MVQIVASTWEYRNGEFQITNRSKRHEFSFIGASVEEAMDKYSNMAKDLNMAIYTPLIIDTVKNVPGSCMQISVGNVFIHTITEGRDRIYLRVLEVSDNDILVERNIEIGKFLIYLGTQTVTREQICGSYSIADKKAKKWYAKNTNYKEKKTA